MKSPITNWHAIGALLAFLIVAGAGLYVGLNIKDAIELGGAAAALGATLGLFSAADTQMAEKVGTDIMPVIANVEKTLMEKHADNAKEIAVHTAVLNVSPASALGPKIELAEVSSHHSESAPKTVT